jgi:hypothetical protein
MEVMTQNMADMKRALDGLQAQKEQANAGA